MTWEVWFRSSHVKTGLHRLYLPGMELLVLIAKG